ncbi:MAG: hypothetical protein H0W74_12555 [Sphingosinicella sp.]|nr:hypothetical protein [Sphingosinicella sp.]
MPSAIGFRGYLITVHEKGDRSLLPFPSKVFSKPPAKFLPAFFKSHLNPTRNAEAERSWYFEEKDRDGFGNSAGYIHYGTFGYASKIKNHKTKATNYERQVDDVEEIPLFYEFWLPEKANHAFVMFQSFAGKSCINLVISQLQEALPRQIQDTQWLLRNFSRLTQREDYTAPRPLKS